MTGSFIQINFFLHIMTSAKLSPDSSLTFTLGVQACCNGTPGYNRLREISRQVQNLHRGYSPVRSAPGSWPLEQQAFWRCSGSLYRMVRQKGHPAHTCFWEGTFGTVVGKVRANPQGIY